MKLIIAFVLFLLGQNIMYSQKNDPNDIIDVQFSVEQKDSCISFVVAKIKFKQKKWHINSVELPKCSSSQATSLDIKQSKQIKALETIEPTPKTIYDPVIKETLSYHEGNIEIKRKFIISSRENFKISGSFGFQLCNNSTCIPPEKIDFNLEVKGCLDSPTTANNIDKVVLEKAKINETVLKNKAGKQPVKSLLNIFLISFFSGFAALLTPCVFPMIPLTVSFFTRANKKRIKGITNAIIYGISIILIYVLLGTIVTALLGPSFLNSLSTNVWLNLIFFAILTIFAISFMGAFDISLPSSWQNKVDRASGKGGLIGIFFMAFALAIVSFSCTGPIVGTLLVESASIGGYAPLVGMFGFSLAIALPFTVFAIFPGWLSSMPKSGAWLNTVKVTLGFIELALALKFLSNADLVLQTHYLEREMFLSVWIAIFLSLSIYLFGFINLSHDTKPERISVGRFMTGLFSLVFVIYLLPGIWGAPLKIISGFPPPLNYSEWKKYDEYKDEHGRHVGVHGIMMFDNLKEALVYAEKVKKPIMLDFTGWACANCRRMEELVWSNEQILPILKEKVIVVSLYTDDKNYLTSEEQKKMIKTVGEKWTDLQLKRYNSNSQPLYRMLTHEDLDLSNGSASYQTHGNPNEFKKWLEKGIAEYENIIN